MSYYGADKVVENYNIMGPVKAALESVSRYLASELGSKNIRVHAVSRPAAHRAASGIAHFDQLIEDAIARAPQNRLVEIGDVGTTCAFLISDAARPDQSDHLCRWRPPHQGLREHAMTRDEHAFADILQQAIGLGPLPMAVAHPCSREALLERSKPPTTASPPPSWWPRRQAGQAGRRTGSGPEPLRAGRRATQPRRRRTGGEPGARRLRRHPDEGDLHTDEFMGEALARGTGIRTDRRISHVWIMKVETYPRYLFITDAAINIEPDLLTKRDICQNAIDLTQALGISQPVAILAAVETINPAMRSTLDAAALCKMADRGQITGAILDGPLAFDNAISREAADSKGIVSPVAGDPDILLVPDLEAGNMLGKQLTYLAAAASAGIVMGARAPSC